MNEFKYIFIALGNPLDEYKGTRHNIAADFAKEFAEINGYTVKYDKYLNSFIFAASFDCGSFLFVLPQTYMNKSGEALKALLKEFKDIKNKIVLVHDELNIDLGKIKISKNKSAGGHNGVQSVIDAIKTKDFYRIRIGISNQGRVPANMEKYVLDKFSLSEQEKLKESFDLFQKVLYSFVCEGPSMAMNKFN